MNVFTRFLTSLRSNGWFGPYNSSDPALAALFGRPPVSSGVQVDEQKALNSSVVWACVQLIAGTLGSLPLIHYRRLPNGGKARFTESRLYRLLHDAPNNEMSASTFAETLTAHLLLWGNAFAEIRRDNKGQVGALWPIEPWRVQGEREGKTLLRYVVDGSTKLELEEMLHIPGLTPDGLWGYSPIQKAREALGLLLAAEKFGGTFFGQGSAFGGILTHPGRLAEPAEAKLRASLEARAQGVDRAHNFVILQEGMRYDRIGIPPNDAQFLETRKFQVGEIARWFGVPPHMIGDVERSTSWGTGIEAQNIGFVTYTLRRWLVRFAQEMTRKLISPLERNLQFVEFLVDGLLRGDTTTRYQAYQVGRNGGWFSANDIRRLENLDPIGDAGDVYLVPSNMVPADRLDAVIDAQIAPKTPPAPPAAPTPEESASERALAEGLAELEGNVQYLMDLGRAALARVEQIKALPAPPAPPPTDLTPVLEKVDTADRARQEAFAQFTERLTGDLARLDAIREAVEQIAPTITGALPAAPAPADFTPVLVKLESLEQDRRAQEERLAAVRPGVQLMIEEVARDFVRREADRATRAAGAPDKLAAWIEDFYPRQADYAVKKFLGSMQVYTQLVGRPDDAEHDIRTHIGDYVQESRVGLLGLLALPPEDVKPAVTQLTLRWEAERPVELARALMAGSLGRPLVPLVLRDVPPPAPVVPVVPAPVIAEEPETRVVEREVVERDPLGRAQKVREIHDAGGATVIVEKEVVERNAIGRVQKIRETHTRKKGAP
jgi:HK97 family phage portal protein